MVCAVAALASTRTIGSAGGADAAAGEATGAEALGTGDVADGTMEGPTESSAGEGDGARRAFAEPSAHVKLVVGLSTLVIALLMGFTTASPQSLLRYAALFSVAELLVVPATLSLSTALAPAGRLSTWLACCFLVTGLGGWLGAWLPPSAAHFVALAAIAVTLTVAICGRSWPSFQPKHTASPPTD